jgi:hypothetical protein
MFDKVQKRIGQRAEQALSTAVDKTISVMNTTFDTGARVKTLMDDPDGSITIESLVLVFVDTVRDENGGERPASRAGVIDAYRGRHQLVKWISRFGPWGATASHLATLYSEAAILCDVSDAGQLGLAREQLGAHILVLWGVMPDHDLALSAMNEEDGKSVGDYLRARLPTKDFAGNPDAMSKRQIVGLLWKLRSLRPSKLKGGSGTVEDMIENAEVQLRPHVAAADPIRESI